ncbi:hypothetical protein Tco_1053133 [Tanacetum coccineum]
MPPPLVLTVVVTTTIIVDVTSAPTPRAGTRQVPPSIFKYSASTGEANQDIAGLSHPVGIELSMDSFFVSQDVDSETLQQIYIPKWNVTNDSSLDDLDVCRDVIDHLAPPALFSQLHSMDYEQLFAEFNVGTTRLSCLGCEVRLWLEHELRVISESAKAICLRGQVVVVKAAEVARASELNGLKEQNVFLEGQVTALESAVVVKNTELESSNAQIVKLAQDLSNLQLSCDELSIKAASLESNKDKLIDQVSQLESTCFRLCEEVMGYKLFKEQIEAVQDMQVKVLNDRTCGYEVSYNRLGIPCLLLGGAIGPAIEKRHAVGWLPSHKDANIADLMGLLHLEGLAAETPEAIQLQPSPEQLMLPIHRLEDQVVIGETFLSFSLDVANARVQRLKRNVASQEISIFDALVPLIEPLSAKNLVAETSTSGVPATATTTALSTTFIQDSTIPLVPVTDHEVSDVGPSTKVSSPLAIIFEKETLETTPEHGASD